MQTKSPDTSLPTEAEESALLTRSFIPPPGANGQFHGFAELGERMAKAKQSAEAMAGAITRRARETTESTNAYVHAQPWKAVGAAAVGGLLLGFLLARRA